MFIIRDWPSRFRGISTLSFMAPLLRNSGPLKSSLFSFPAGSGLTTKVPKIGQKERRKKQEITSNIHLNSKKCDVIVQCGNLPFLQWHWPKSTIKHDISSSKTLLRQSTVPLGKPSMSQSEGLSDVASSFPLSSEVSDSSTPVCLFTTVGFLKSCWRIQLRTWVSVDVDVS